ncbi:tRNA preQ1(34) S-adenosylmethionine ribosyltransferase-isomerase QueA [bacterium]|nr:tRNA preQ1(34) S-adenosylmethionine ribosyltransferase-isomerase QueA [bacterium]
MKNQNSYFYKLEDYNYILPEGFIARYPSEKRSLSKLLVLNKKNAQIEDKYFKDIIEYFRAGDLLIVNDTKVIKARFFGKKKDTGAKIELLIMDFIKDAVENTFLCLSRPYKRLNAGTIIEYDMNNYAEILEKKGEGKVLVRFHLNTDFLNFSQKYGHVPLPPYIKREDESIDEKRYQTVYAKNTGAVAAPTAGLHFNQELLKKLNEKGVNIEYLTLHTGYGTFAPMNVKDIRDFKIHSEYFEIKQEVIDAINDTKTKGNKVFAVGTTSVRTLEYVFKNEQKILKGFCDLYIYPGFEFKVVDAMITNFHLPYTSLLVLVSSFAGYDKIMKAYKHAISNKYRFYSYGDAMLIK